VTFDPQHLLGGDAIVDALPRLLHAVRPRRVVNGWATVELDRAEAELSKADLSNATGDGTHRSRPVGDDTILGARGRLFRPGDAHEVVLLEASTEGRLAAALARYGEGTVARYLLVDAAAAHRARAAGFTLSTEGGGPFGIQRLVVVGPRYGPFVLLAGLDPDAARPPATESLRLGDPAAAP